MAYCIRRIRSKFEQEMYVPFLKKIEPDEQSLRDDIANGKLYLLEEHGKGVFIALVRDDAPEVCELRIIRPIGQQTDEKYQRTLIRFLLATHEQDFKRMIIRLRLSTMLNIRMLDHLGFTHIAAYRSDETNPVVYERTFI